MGKSKNAKALIFFCFPVALIVNASQVARGATVTFTFNGGTSDTTQTSYIKNQNGLALTIDGLNGGSFLVSRTEGLCAYWAQNNNNNTVCNNSANTGYNGLMFKVTSPGAIYNVKLSSFTTAGRNGAAVSPNEIISTFSGASGYSENVKQVSTITG